MIHYKERPSVARLRADIKSLREGDFVKVGERLVAIGVTHAHPAMPRLGEWFVSVSFSADEGVQFYGMSELGALADEFGRRAAMDANEIANERLSARVIKDEALAASERLHESLKDRVNLIGVGVGSKDGKPCLYVYVAKNSRKIRGELVGGWENFPVKFVTMGNLFAAPKAKGSNGCRAKT